MLLESKRQRELALRRSLCELAFCKDHDRYGCSCVKARSLFAGFSRCIASSLGLR